MKTAVIKISLVLFAMFFGAGNVIFPVLLGDFAGEHAWSGISGFLLGGIIVPYLGLIAMMLYGGDYLAFFQRIGKRAGFWLFVLLIALLGPIGSIPRLLTISYATLYPYLFGINFPTYALVSCIVIFLFVYRPTRVLGLLAYVLTPILLASLAIIIFRGITSVPEPLHAGEPAFAYGLELGYSLLDLVAVFLYATLVLDHIKKHSTTQSQMIHATLWSSLISASLLAATYIGLAFVGAFHARFVNADGPVEEVLRAVSLSFLGPAGGVVASVAVGLACLTTAISLVVVCSNFLRKEILHGHHRSWAAIFIILGLSFAISNLGFTGIARLIGPILNILHPALIALCLCNIGYKLYNFKPIKTPFYITLAATIAFYLFP